MGLLAKAGAYLEQEQLAQQQAQNTASETLTAGEQPKMQNHRPKLKKLVATFMMGLALQSATPLGFFNFGKAKHKGTVIERAAFQPVQRPNEAEIAKHIATFQEGLKSRVTPTEREILAKMLYGEAGRGADPFEVLHTVLNRAASPLFKGSIKDIVTAPNQYVGYNPKNPVKAHYLRIVNMGVDEWEANGCKKIDGCDHFYFVTGKPGKCNKFEISKDPDGRWVPHDEKEYAEMEHYCDVATNQAIRYYATYTPEQTR